METDGNVGGRKHREGRPSHEDGNSQEKGAGMHGHPPFFHRNTHPGSECGKQDEADNENWKVRRPALDQGGENNKAPYNNKAAINSIGIHGLQWKDWSHHTSRLERALPDFLRAIRKGSLAVGHP